MIRFGSLKMIQQRVPRHALPISQHIHKWRVVRDLAEVWNSFLQISCDEFMVCSGFPKIDAPTQAYLKASSDLLWKMGHIELPFTGPPPRVQRSTSMRPYRDVVSTSDANSKLRNYQSLILLLQRWLCRSNAERPCCPGNCLSARAIYSGTTSLKYTWFLLATFLCPKGCSVLALMSPSRTFADWDLVMASDFGTMISSQVVSPVSESSLTLHTNLLCVSVKGNNTPASSRQTQALKLEASQVRSA